MTPSEKYIMTQETGLWYDGLRDVYMGLPEQRAVYSACVMDRILSPLRDGTVMPSDG